MSSSLPRLDIRGKTLLSSPVRGGGGGEGGGGGNTARMRKSDERKRDGRSTSDERVRAGDTDKRGDRRSGEPGGYIDTDNDEPWENEQRNSDLQGEERRRRDGDDRGEVGEDYDVDRRRGSQELLSHKHRDDVLQRGRVKGRGGHKTVQERHQGLRSPGTTFQKSAHPLHIVESDVQRLSIGSPIPRLDLVADDDSCGYSPPENPTCPVIKVDVVDRTKSERRRLTPSTTSLLTPRTTSSGNQDLYQQSQYLQQSRSENDLRYRGHGNTNTTNNQNPLYDTMDKNTQGRFQGHGGNERSGLLTARGEGLLTARRLGEEPAGALCSPLVNRRPVRLLPLRHDSLPSLHGDQR